jgi:hypothetical protein
MPETAKELEALKVEKAKAETEPTAPVQNAQPPAEPTPPEPNIAPAPQAVDATAAITLQTAPLPRRGMPAALAPNEAGLIVRIKKSVLGLTVYIDDQPVGEAPWEGVLPPGEHKIRAAGGGFETIPEEISILPGQAHLVDLDAAPEGRLTIGKYSVFLPIRYVTGSVFMEDRRFSNSHNEPWSTIPGLGFGWIVADKGKSFWELAIAAFGPPSGSASLSARYQRRLVGRVLFGGLEVELGGLYPGLTHNYTETDSEIREKVRLRGGGYLAVRAGVSLFLSSSFEMRFDPLGMMIGVGGFEFEQRQSQPIDVEGVPGWSANQPLESPTRAGFILAWYPAFNLALRF